MNVVFMGTPEFSVPILEELIKRHNVLLVVSQPDKRVGRKQELKNTPVKECAIRSGIEVFQPIKIKEDYKRILDVNPDIIITAAYGQMVPEILLNTPKYKAINVHSSLLPKYRGGAPMHKAIIDGNDKTGVTIMYMSKLMDQGDIILQKEIPILDTDNVGTIHDKLSILGKDLLIEALKLIEEGKVNPIKQNNDEATFAYNILREDEKINFNKTCREIFNQIRGLNPWPVAYMEFNNNPIKVYNSHYEIKDIKGVNGEIVSLNGCIGIKCLDGIIYIDELQPSGKKKMSAKDFLNGQKLLNIKDVMI